MAVSKPGVASRGWHELCPRCREHGGWLWPRLLRGPASWLAPAHTTAGEGAQQSPHQPPAPFELLLPLCARLAMGTAARWVLPGHLPDSGSGSERGQGAKLDGRAACNSHGHRQQADERAEELDLECNSAPKPTICLLHPVLCLLRDPSSLCSHLSSAFLPPQHRRTSETSISPPGSSIGSPNRVICVSTALPLVCAGQDRCSRPREGSGSSQCCFAV